MTVKGERLGKKQALRRLVYQNYQVKKRKELAKSRHNRKRKLHLAVAAASIFFTDFFHR